MVMLKEKKPLEVGRKYGTLTVLAPVDPLFAGGKLRPAYKVRCDCGREKVMLKQNVRRTCGFCYKSAAMKARWASKRTVGQCKRIGCRGIAFKRGYCVMHHRLNNMRSRAISSRKYSPKFAELEALVPPGMKCQPCGRAMIWYAGTVVSNLITLQHDRSGTIRLICQGCNSGHAWVEGDRFYEIGPGKRQCGLCKAIKPVSEFVKQKLGASGIRRSGRCLQCHNAWCKQWKAEHRKEGGGS